MAFFIEKLSLTQFRSYTSARLNCDHRPVILTGPNGAGKTNVLEAISLLMPGRGIRRARIAELKNIKASPAEYWAVSSKLNTPFGPTQIGTGQHPDQDGRMIRIDGIDQKSQTPLAEISAIVWLTPQMDGLFLDSPSVRRRFLDRMVSNFNPKHQSHTSKYDKLLRERSSILKTQRAPDPHWLSALETQIAEMGIAIAAARHLFCERLEQAIERLKIDESDFPFPRVEIHGLIDDFLKENPAVDAEEFFKQRLSESRQIDSYTGGAQDGTHKSDFRVYHKGMNMPAENCSTGEQKGLLVKLILGQAALVKAERGFPPLLLLDDIAAHLDARRRDILFETILGLDCQSWMTGTDVENFSGLKDSAQYFSVKNSIISGQN
mgnify:CR=1 FL=1